MAPRLGIPVDAYRALAEAGYSASEAARRLGVSPQSAHAVAKRNGFAFEYGYIKREKRHVGNDAAAPASQDADVTA